MTMGTKRGEWAELFNHFKGLGVFAEIQGEMAEHDYSCPVVSGFTPLLAAMNDDPEMLEADSSDTFEISCCGVLRHLLECHDLGTRVPDVPDGLLTPGIMMAYEAYIMATMGPLDRLMQFLMDAGPDVVVMDIGSAYPPELMN